MRARRETSVESGVALMKARRPRERDWLITVACALGLLATVYVLVQLGVPIEVTLATLVFACLAVCGWAAFIASRAWKKADAAIRAQAEARRDAL